LFTVLFFAPVLSVLGSLVNPKIGAAVYNAAHTRVVYGPLAVYGYLSGFSVALAVGLIGLAHVGLESPPGLRTEVITRLWLHAPWPPLGERLTNCRSKGDRVHSIMERVQPPTAASGRVADGNGSQTASSLLHRQRRSNYGKP
jgi:hypothetical protein